MIQICVHRKSILLVVAVAMSANVALGMDISVLQVEADYSTNPEFQYAPVHFEPPTFTNPRTTGGVTYHGMSEPVSGTVSTYSDHAYDVRTRLLAADGPNNPVKDIWCLYMGHFLNNYVKTSAASQTAVRPAAFGNNIKIVNNSWVKSYLTQGTPNSAANLDAVRRLDYMIWREDLVMVNGAVSPWGDPWGPTPLDWASRNGIAVRGTQTFTPSHADGIGKRHADLWGPKSGSVDEASSYETPGVAGYAAALIDAADDNGWSNGLNGLRHEVVKSILMTGADKTAYTVSPGFTAWTSNGVNNLDDYDGAGRADYATSLSVLNAGPQSMATVNGAVVNAPIVTTASAGWWLGSDETAVSANGAKALIVDLTHNTLTDLTATLAWDVTQRETTLGPFDCLDTTTNTGVIFANLDLELRPVTYNGGTYTLGSRLEDIPGLISESADDNVEHLYFTDDTLDPGFYAFVVSNNSNFDWSYGFSYRLTSTVAIPEPGTLSLLIVLVLSIGCIRRARIAL